MTLRRGGLVVPSLSVPNLLTGFEDGTINAFDDPASAVPPTVEAAAAHTGSFGATFAPNLSTSFVRWRAPAGGGTEQSIPANQTHWSLRLYLRYPGALPAITPNPSIVSVIQATGVDDFTCFYNISQNRIQWDLDALDLARSSMTLEAGRFYLLEARGDYSHDTWTTDVRIDGIEQDSIATSGNGPSTINSVQLGISAATQQWTGHFDDVAFAYSTSPLRFLGPKNA